VNILHPRVVVEQAVAVDPFQAAFFQLHGGRHKAIGADDFQVLFVPQNQVQVIVIIAVDVAAFAAAFADRAKGNLAQAAQLAQQRRIFLTAALPQIDDFAICRAPEALRLAEFALKQGAILGTGNCAFGFKYPGIPCSSGDSNDPSVRAKSFGAVPEDQAIC
jgi:PleD family two-component response regulator